MRVHHLAFRTRDLARLERFYTDLLGLHVARRDEERSVWLRAGGTLLMLEQADADRWRRALAAAGVLIEDETGFTFYFRDPDGRRVALSHY